MKHTEIKVGVKYRFWLSDPKSLFVGTAVKKVARPPHDVTMLCEPMFGPTFEKVVPPNQVDHEWTPPKPKKKPKPSKKAG